MLQYANNSDDLIDLKKNWIQYNDQSFEELKYMIDRMSLKFGEDSDQTKIFNALLALDLLLVSEHSYEQSAQARYKQPDYDFYFENIGSQEHSTKIQDLHSVALSLLKELIEPLEALESQNLLEKLIITDEVEQRGILMN